MEPQQLFRILRRRAWKVACWGIALGLIVGFASQHWQKPVYQTSAQVLLQPSNAAQSITQQPVVPVDPTTYDASQVTLVGSLAVAQAASAAMPGHPAPGLLVGQMSATVNPTTNVMAIVVKSGDRAEAQAAANAFATAYIANSYKTALGNDVTTLNGIPPQLARLQKQLGVLETKIFAAGKAKRPNVGILTSQYNVVQAQYVALLTTQQGLKTTINLTRNQAQLVSPAALPGSPISPKPLKDAALGLMAGLLIGFGIELLREKFDDNVNTAEEVEEITGRPLLAQIPKDDNVSMGSPVVIRPGEFSEAIRALRTGLQFLGVDRPLRRIVVSSAGTGDGKTTVAAHLAVAFAEAGFITVLVSGDMRRPQVESLFGSTSSGPGLSSLLATGPLRPRFAFDVDLNPHSNGNGNGVASNGNGSNGNGSNGNGNGHGDAYGLHPSAGEAPDTSATRMKEFLQLLAIKTVIDNLTVIPAGPVPPNPAELLGSIRMRETLDALAANADVIIIDTPPALVVTDSVVLADSSDGVLLVMSSAKSTRRDLKRLMAIYENADVPVLGAVLNRARSRGRNEYYAAYKSPSPPKPQPVSWRERRKEAKAAG